jgi:uncharacterized protein (TIGR02271 family)
MMGKERTMSFNSRTSGSVTASQIQQGWDVYSSDGEKVGDVAELHEGYFIAKQGMVFSHEHYIPFAAISRVEHDRVYLAVTKDQIEAQGWDEAPSRGASVMSAPNLPRDQERMEDQRTMQLREEQLRTNKELREVGEVELRKEVVAEQQTLDVPVTREEVVIERHPVDRAEGARRAAGEIGGGETLRVPVRKEQVSVDKDTVVTEEIEVGKRQVQDTQRITDTVRREEAVLDHEGDIDVDRKEPRRR